MPANATIPVSSSAVQKIRVLCVIPGAREGASMIFSKRLAATLQHNGAVVHTFFLVSRTSVFALVREWLRLRREVRAFQPDLVHADYGTMTAFLCATATRVPLVVVYRGSDLNPSPTLPWPRAALGRLLSQMAALRARRIVCVSLELKSRLWWRRERVTVIPSGVDTEMFTPRSRARARTKLGWQAEEQVILFNASATPAAKGLDLARAAIEIASRKNEKIRMEAMNGSVDPEEVPWLMNAADCLLVASDFEGSPCVVQESLACGLPVVSVDVGDVRERLEGVQPSRIVARDPDSIAQALLDVMSTGRRSNGREVVDEISFRTVAARVMGVYEAALS